MESANGVCLEVNESGVIEKTQVEESVLDVNKEEQNVGNGEEVLNVNGISENVIKSEEGLNSSGVVAEASVTVSESKISNPSKGPNGGNSKNNKMTKYQPNSKGSSTFSRTPRPSLSQSLSFPSRGVRPDGMKKSIDGYPVKTDAKYSRANGAKPEVPFLNGSATSASCLNHPNRRASTGVNLKEANSNGGGASARRTSLASIPSVRRSTSGKSGSVNANAKYPLSEVSLSVDQNSKPVKTVLPIKEDDDARSTTSSNTSREQRRTSGSGFAFRLDERAEKRKEFFTKLEEKIHAKEVEKSNLQEKSKESQEAEIKQLRKSLTFKATPMPSFYKEPPPPKVELKKIPATRPVSPKFGRHKSSIAATNNSLEGGGPCLSPRVNRDQSNSTKGIQVNCDKDSKKPIRKSQFKLQSRESVAPKTEGKPAELKPKTTGTESQNQKACAGETEESQNQSLNPPELEDRTDLESERIPAQDDGPILSSPNPEIMPDKITI